MDLKELVRDIPDFPAKGILFRDITTVLNDSEGLKLSIDSICEQLKDLDFDVVLGPESRGFIFGMPVAYALSKRFVPVRKPGKLPAEVISKSYELEYGSNVLEMHKDALKPGDKVVIIDDLIATGGTSKAIVEMVEEQGASVAALAFFIELEALEGRKTLDGYTVTSVIAY